MSTLDREALHLLRQMLDAEPGDRAAMIDAECGSNIALAMRVRELLARVDDTDALVDPHGEDGDVAGIPIGPYRLLRRIGRGGMGEVFLAERADGAWQREVALKRIWGGFTPLTERFLRERRVLALLQHPHIAQLLDGGVTSEGQPWFAMEFVRGETITHWCDTQRASLEQRVTLFRQVCSAAQFAHRNLVVHRDIKPANVVVDASGSAKLLDFGIAKLLDEADPAQTQTHAMTPAWSAPEQRRGEPVSTLTDVYQLGLLLHALLAGTPFAKPTDPPQRLSLAWAALQREHPDKAIAVAAARGVTPTRLAIRLQGDLERIVTRATADDPRERYPSAEALSDDLDRWLRHLPVHAHRVTFGYRTRKFLRRHRAATGLVAMLALAFVGASGFAWQRLQAERAQFRRAEATVGFMRELFVSTTPDKTDGASLSAEQLLDRASARLPQQSSLDAMTRAYLEGELGNTYIELGRYAKAEVHLQHAIDTLRSQREQHAEAYLEWLADLAFAQIAVHRSQVALDLLADNDAFIRAALPTPSRQRARLVMQRGEALLELGRITEAERDLRAAVDDLRTVSGSPSVALLNSQVALGRLLSDRNRFDEALKFYEQARRDAQRVPDLNESTRNAMDYYRALTLANLGRYDDAIAGYRTVLPRWIAREGEQHPYTDVLRTALARAYSAQGRLGEARTTMAELRRTLDAGKADAKRVALADLSQARIELDAMQFDVALSLATRASAHLESAYLQPAPRRARARNLLGEVMIQQRDCDRAEPLLSGAASDIAKTFGTGPHAEKARALDGLGRCRLLRGDHTGARRLLADAHDQFQTIHGADDRRTLRSEVHWRWADVAAADRNERLQALRPRVVTAFGAHHPVTIQFDNLLHHVEQGSDLPPLRRVEIASGQTIENGLLAPTEAVPVGLVGGD